MSIHPRIIKVSDIKPVTLHMRVENNNEKSLSGRMVFIITDPNKKNEKIEELVTIKALDKIDKYFTYKLRKNPLLGRYFVEARFHVGDESILSENHKTDFFDVVDTE